MQDSIETEATGFDSLYVGQEQSPTIRKIFRETLGFAELDEAFVPFSFVSLKDLQNILASLNVSKGELLADIGCGNGSIGLWLTQSSEARLVGVDVSAAALEQARNKAQKLHLAAQTKFQPGSFETTGLASESVDAVVSIDAIWLASDQQQAFKELARILKKGGHLVFTSWEQHIPMSFVKQPIKNYRPLLEQAGFEIVSYDYPPHFEPLQLKIYERVRLAQDVLMAEMGAASQSLIGEAHFVPGLVDGVNYISPENGPHVLIVAKRV